MNAPSTPTREHMPFPGHRTQKEVREEAERAQLQEQRRATFVPLGDVRNLAAHNAK